MRFVANLTEHQCPRCGGMIPNDSQPGLYPGALSRDDNRTEVCSACGLDEALRLLPGAPPALERAGWFDRTGQRPLLLTPAFLDEPHRA